MVVEDNVVAFPALLAAGAPVRPDRLLQPARGPGPDVAPAFSGLPAEDRSAWPAYCGGEAGAHRSGRCTRRSTAVRGAGRAAAARAGVRAHLAVAEPVPLPDEADYPRSRRSTAPGTGSTPACAQPTRRSCCPPRSPAGGRRADLPVTGLAGQRRCGADEAADRRARRDTAPLHRVHGPAARAAAARTCGARSSCRRPGSSRWSTS